jgi:hypothetical protein
MPLQAVTSGQASPAPGMPTQPFTASIPPIVLAGLAAADLVRLLGEPAERSPTGQGERWTYRSGNCEIEIFVFPDVANGRPVVLDDRLAAGPPGPDAKQACLRKLRDEHAL